MEMDNNLYNLMLQYTVESRSLWRIKKDYQNDASSDENTKVFWEKLMSEKEANLTEIKNLIKERI